MASGAENQTRPPRLGICALVTCTLAIPVWYVGTIVVWIVVAARFRPHVIGTSNATHAAVLLAYSFIPFFWEIYTPVHLVNFWIWAYMYGQLQSKKDLQGEYILVRRKEPPRAKNDDLETTGAGAVLEWPFDKAE